MSRIAAAALAALALSLGVALPASAAGVPGVITTYIANDLIDDLNEFYGPGQQGAGLLFTNSTTTTAPDRVLGFTPAGTDPAVRRLNRWVTVIEIDESIVGVATISIEPLSNEPQLDLYLASPDFGTVIAALPDGAQLVNDAEREAWFSLEGETLTPLVAGTSGVSEPIALDAYLPTTPTDAAAAPSTAPDGLMIAGLILVLIVLALAVERFFPFWRRRAAAAQEDARQEPVEPAETAAPTDAIAPSPVAKPRAPRTKPTASV